MKQEKYYMIGLGRGTDVLEATIIPVHGKLQDAVIEQLKYEYDSKPDLWFMENKKDYFHFYYMVIPQGLMVNLPKQAVLNSLDMEERIIRWKEE